MTVSELVSRGGSDNLLPVHHLQKPYLLLIGDMADRTHSKTGLGLKDWCGPDCIGQLRFTPDAVDLGLPQMTPTEAKAAGAGTIVVGITPAGGALSPSWYPTLLDALDAGLDIAAGLHVRLASIPELVERARLRGRTLHDVRYSGMSFRVGSGLKRPGKRMLMVGTDCAVGKKYSALVIARDLRARGIDADFRATGQTGVLIAGQGVAVDAVVADFLSGAAEAISPANHPDHWDIIEGQGSLFHPSFAAVTLGLVHGSQPDLMVLCHNPSRPHIADHPDYPIPSLTRAIAVYEDAARLTNKSARVVGISLNTADFDPSRSADLLAAATTETGLPAIDPIRSGAAVLLDSLQF